VSISLWVILPLYVLVGIVLFRAPKEDILQLVRALTELVEALTHWWRR
jgi:hypothetical protein